MVFTVCGYHFHALLSSEVIQSPNEQADTVSYIVALVLFLPVCSYDGGVLH